jgi:hypothetical protein
VCPVPTVDVNEGHITDVIAYDFVPQLLSLLQNRNIMIEENLLLDVSDPLKPFEGPVLTNRKSRLTMSYIN